MADFDPGAYLDSQAQPQPPPQAQDYQPKITTFYYPETPEATKAAGLGYGMEGGIHGAGKFSDIDLREHTFEKYNPKDPNSWVAIAMPGEPTGKYYNMVTKGVPYVGRHVDTGGGLKPGQSDIATENPDLARGYSEHDKTGTELSASQPIVRRPLSDQEVKDLLGGIGEEPKEPAPRQKAPSPPPAPIPEPPPTPDLPMTPEPIQAQGATPPPPIPVPQTDFQQAIGQQPQSALFAGPPSGFDPAAYLAAQQQTPAPSPTQAPTAAAFNPSAYLAQNTSRKEIPQGKGFMAGLGEGVMENLKGLVPHDAQGIKQFGTILAGPSNPDALMRLAIQAALSDASVAQAAIKSGSPFSYESGKAVGTLVPQYAMQVQGLAAGGLRGSPRVKVAPPIQTQPQPNVGAGMGSTDPIPHDVILRPANRMPDGKIFEANSHGQAMTLADRAGYPREIVNSSVPGYTTKLGRFLNKDEAYNQAVANKQIDLRSYDPEGDRAKTLESFRFHQTARDINPLPPPAPTQKLNPVKGSGAFRKTYQVDKTLGDLMESIGAAKEAGYFRGEIAFRNVTDGLTKPQVAELGKYLVSRRLSTLNEEHPQILPEAEMTRIASDPAIAKALDTYRQDVKPDIEGWRKQAGLSEEAAAGKEPEFISLVATGDDIGKGGVITRAARLSRTTRFARKATGTFPQYSTDLKEIFAKSYSDAMKISLTNRLYETAQAKGLTETNNFGDLPLDVQDNLKGATERPPTQQSGLAAGWKAYQRVATGLALSANPTELLNHMRRQLNVVASVPPVGRGIVARLEAVIPYLGPKVGTFTRAIMDDMSKPENAKILQDIFDNGGGSSRSFSQYVSNVPGLKYIQMKTHNLLFGIPRGKGMGGWDLRMRVQLEKIRRAAEGNVDPQRIREFSNQLGQYGSNPDWIIRGLRTINPYAATTLPMRLTELKRLVVVGDSGLKDQGFYGSIGRRLETTLRGTGGTMLGLAVANYALSGKWPWQNDPGHEFDLNLGKKGADNRNLYLKLRVIAPELARALATIAVPNLLRERTSKEADYGAAVGVAGFNQLASLVSSPALSSIVELGSGKVLYLTKAPGQRQELMHVAGETGKFLPGRLGSQVEQALAQANPAGTLFMEEPYKAQPTGALKYIESPVFGTGLVRPFGSMYSEAYEKAPKGGHNPFATGGGSTKKRKSNVRNPFASGN